MRHLASTTVSLFMLAACGGGQPAHSPVAEPEAEAPPAPESDAETHAAPINDGSSEDDAAEGDANDSEFVLRKSTTAGAAHGATPSKIKPTKTEAAMKFFVIDKEKKAPIEGIVVSLTAPDGKKYYTEETDTKGYAEVLVPVGQKYDLVYLSLGSGDIEASVPVSDKPNQNIKLTLRYKGYEPEGERAKGFVLDGVNFDSGKATIRAESFPRLDSVVEYMTHKKRSRIVISGHTDNVGNPKNNKTLSEKRAQACRAYLMSKGIDGSRIEAVGYGDEQPIAPNDTAEGRQQNRRIEATPL